MINLAKSIVIALLCVFAGYSQAEGMAEYQKISAEEAHKMMQELTEFVLLDVRTLEEYRTERIEGALLIPDYELKERAQMELPDKEKTILIYCRSGRRSAHSAKLLLSLGYANVYDFGGIRSWPYATVSGK